MICRLADMMYIKVNRGFLHLVELTRDQVVGRPFSEIDLFSDAYHRDDALALVARGNPVPQWETRLVGANGSRAVIVAGQPIEISGKACMLFTFMDLEPRREAERELQEARSQTQADFEALYTETPVALHALDAEGRIITVSNRWLELLQFEREEVVGRPITDFMTSAAKAIYRGDRASIPASARVTNDIEYQFVKKSGSVVDLVVSTRTGQDRQGTLVRTTAVLTDVTDRKHSEERFAKAFSLAPIPMMLGKVEHWEVADANQAFLTMIRRPAAEVVGCQIDQLRLWSDEADGTKVGDLIRREGSIRNLNVTIRASDGTAVDCLLSAEPVNLQGQRCSLVVMQDITDQRRSEAQLFEALETVMRDTSWFSRSVIEKLAHLRQPGHASPRDAALDDLTKREVEILSHLSQGQKDDQIGSVLGLSRSTVRNHVAAIYAKLGVHSRSSAIVWARERGLAGPIRSTKPR